MSGIEIERKFLLDGVPDLPAGATARRIEQGYLPDGGRLRRTVGPDGAVACAFTVKEGMGLVRREHERAITVAEFESRWPATGSRRLRKTRHRVEEGRLVWEIDVYEGLDLVLAEVELPSAATRVTLPPWLAPRVVRDVTDEPAYQNYEIALKTDRV